MQGRLISTVCIFTFCCKESVWYMYYRSHTCIVYKNIIMKVTVLHFDWWVEFLGLRGS